MRNTIIFLAISISLMMSCSEKEQSTAQKEEPVIDVKTQKVNAVTQNQVTASGKVESVSSSMITTRQSGYVDQVNVKVGEKVKKGQTLIQLDDSNLQAKRSQVKSNINTAKTAFENAKKDLERYENLKANNSVSKKEFEQIKLQYDNAQSNLEAARQQLNSIESELNYVNIKAPFDGVVTNKFIKAGNLAMPGKPLLNINGSDQYEVISKVGEEQVNQISEGQEVNVYISSVDVELKGKVTEVSSSSAVSGGQYMVKINIPMNDKIKPGMYAEVKIQSENESISQELMIPSSALIYTNDLVGVYTVSKSNTAILRWLKIGNKQADQVEVLSGLNQDDSVIVEADGKLYNGAKISDQ